MTTASKTIVVGLDGSPGSDQALAAAVDMARLRGSSLKIIHAYHTMPNAFLKESHDDMQRFRQEAEESVEKYLATAPSMAGLNVEVHTVPGGAAEVLIEASKDAQLLVVGTRGLGGFEGLLMGSVSSKCVHHAHCPVLVVR